MAYLSKLVKRITAGRTSALGLSLALVTVLVLTQACGGGGASSVLGLKTVTIDRSLVRLSVEPRSAQRMLGDSVALVAYGHFVSGDSAVVPATWSARLGTISDAGFYIAIREGVDTIRAISKAEPSVSDAATFQVLTPVGSSAVRKP